MFLLLQSSFPVGQSLGPGPGISYSPYLSPVTHGMGLVATEMLPSNPVIVQGTPAVAMQSSNSSSASQKILRSDKLEVQKPFTHLQLISFTPSVACRQYPCYSKSTHTEAHIYPGFSPYIASDLRVAIFVVGWCCMCRCAESFSGGTAPEERQTVGLPTLVTAQWLTALITQWQCAWTMWRAAAPERSANTFTLLLICRHASKALRAPRATLQPLLWWGSLNTHACTHIRSYTLDSGPLIAFCSDTVHAHRHKHILKCKDSKPAL